MTINFTTYFDQNYQHKFYTLYKSIENNCDDYKVYAFVLDNVKIDDALTELKNVIFINLSELENKYPELFYAKKNRSIVEYYFTLTPFICRYILEIYNFDQITYIDSDSFFFNNPKKLYEFINDSENEIFITEHDNSKLERKYGRFNVGWIVFKNLINSNKCLYDWSQNCINWCFDEIQENKFADQKYLDSWVNDYSKVFIVKDYLINVGPWNFNKIDELNNSLISFHFHNLNINKYFYTTNISAFHNLKMIDKVLIKKIYSEYVKFHETNKNLFSNFEIVKIRSLKFKSKLRRIIKFVIALLKGDYFRIK